MNLDIILVLIFYCIILLFYFKNKKKFEVQNKIILLYKTKWGLKLMDNISKRFPRFLKYFGYFGILCGFLGMILIVYILLKGTFELLLIPGTKPILAPVLPGVKIQGLPVLSFWHWILAILFIATIHEFCHGVYARKAGIKIKSSGFAFLGPILAAFVEPDEKQLSKSRPIDQLSVLSAGPFINIVSSIILLIFTILLLNPVAYSLVDYKGVQVTSLEEGFPAQSIGMIAGEEIISIDNQVIKNIDDFTKSLSNVSPNQEIFIQTTNSSYKLKTTTNPKNNSQGYLGVVVSAKEIDLKEEVVKKYGSFLPNTFLWIHKLFFWLYALSLGVGLFNLLPLGPVDGGRMFLVGISTFIKKEKLAKKIFSLVSFLILFLIFVNLMPYIIKLIIFLFKPFFAFF